MLIMAGLIFPAGVTGVSDVVMGNNLLTYYFDLLLSDNLESVNFLWAPSAIQRADRLNIEYEDIMFKADCNSPVIYDFDRLRDQLMSGIDSKVALDSGLVRLKFKAIVDEQEVAYTYHAQEYGEDFWLVFPQDVYTSDWLTRETKYFRFVIDSPMVDYYNEIAAKELDLFVKKTGERLLIDDERFKLLKQQKIDYYLCSSEHLIQKIAGQKTKGLYDPGSDAIITTVFPDFHLVSRLLVNFKLQKRPRFTLPFMDEGLAIYLGGRWQRSPDVIVDFGEYILDNDISSIDSILSWDYSDNNVMANITYPVDACLVDYLMAQLGVDRFLELYLNLSGNIEFIEGTSPDKSKEIISKYFGQGWNEIRADFDTYFANRDSHGGLIYPGQVEVSKQLAGKSGFEIGASSQWVQVNYTPINDLPPNVIVLISEQDKLTGKKSKLFDEQSFDNLDFERYRYGLRIDKNEIGLYDYATNRLKAKYVYSFDPKPGYFDESGNSISAYFDVGLFGEKMPKMSDIKVIDLN
jgi:hypothetical protein